MSALITGTIGVGHWRVAPLVVIFPVFEQGVREPAQLGKATGGAGNGALVTVKGKGQTRRYKPAKQVKLTRQQWRKAHRKGLV